MTDKSSTQIPFSDLPEGTVTFLFTDIEGSTQLLARLRDKYAILLEEHHKILREAFANWDGHEVDTQGDAFFVAFSRATQAVGAAVETQRILSEHIWPERVPVRVRMGIHTGESWTGTEGYVGMEVYRAARIAHVASGGQVLLSETTAALVRDELPEGVTLLDLGRHLLKDIHRPERISQLVIEGLQSEFPPLTSLEALPPESARPKRVVGACPYKGLAAFQEDDARYYFGREAFIDALEQAVNTRKLVAVIVGSSGSGKSSALFAGLLPRLRKTGKYLVATSRPGSQPFYGLAGALIELLEPELSKTDLLAETRNLAERLSKHEVSLAEVMERVQKDAGGKQKILLVVDQFEELYTLCSDASLQVAFINELLATVEASKARRDGLAVILLTLRADFMGQALAHRPFADALQEASLMLGPMNPQELHMAIEKPAEMQGAAFEPGLVERILDDVGEKPGNLPLLQFTLTQLWERQSDGWLTHADYEAMGCVEGALASYADQVYTGLDETEQELTRRALVQLVQPGEGTEDTRRIATREELGAESWKLIHLLADKRLVVVSRDAQGRDIAEVVHEALIHKWGRFREWMDSDRAFRLWQERLRASYRQWQESGKDEGALLAGAPLAVAQSWLGERGGELNTAEIGYIQASQELQLRQQKERLRRRQWTFAGLSVGLVIALALAAIALFSSQRANRNAIQARQNQATAQSASVLALNEADARATQQAIAEAEKANALHQADLARARELSLAAINNLEINPERSILLALEAVAIAQKSGGSVLPEFQNALHRAVLASRLRLTLRGHTADVWAVAYSPDGAQLATASFDGTAKIWDAVTGQELHTLVGHRAQFWDIAYSPDGNLLAAGDDDGLVVLWSPKTGEKVANLAGHTGSIWKLAFSPDGELLATASQDQTIKIWDTSTGRQIVSLPLNLIVDDTFLAFFIHYFAQLAFSADGTRLLASMGMIIQEWDTQTWQEPLTLQGTAAAISPDGRTLALGQADGSVYLVDAITGEQRLVLSGKVPEAIAYRVVFSQDGSRLVASGVESAKVWDASTGEAFFGVSGASGVKAIFTPDSRRVIITNAGVAKVYDIESGAELFSLAGSGTINDLAFKPGCDNPFAQCGANLATASRDQVARVWDISPSGSSELLVFPALRGDFNPTKMYLNTAELIGPNTVKFQIIDFTPQGFGTVLSSYTASMPAEINAGLGRSLDGTRAALSSSDNSFSIFDVVNGREIITFPIVNEFPFLILNPDLTRLATSIGNTITIWDTTTGQELLELPEYPQWVPWYKYSDDGKYLVVTVGDLSQTIHLLDTATYQEISAWQAHSDVIDDLAFSPDGTRLLSLSEDMTAKIWQLPSGEELLTLRGHTASIGIGAFNWDGTLVATNSFDGTTRVWDASTGQNLLTLSDPAYHSCSYLSFSPDGKYLACRGYRSASEKRLVHIYMLDINDLVDLARSRLTRGFTLEECQQYLHTETCPESP